MATIREQVFERDKGVCCWCGTDTKALREWFPLFQKYPPSESWYQLFEPYLSLLLHDSELWEADHIVPRRDWWIDPSLDLETLENRRTLCVPCHRRRTKDHIQSTKKFERLGSLLGGVAHDDYHAMQSSKDTVFTGGKYIV